MTGTKITDALDGNKEEERYKVVAIRHHVIHAGGQILYLVQWKGYEGDAKEFTWEPKNNIGDDILEDYYKYIGCGLKNPIRNIRDHWREHAVANPIPTKKYKQTALELAKARDFRTLSYLLSLPLPSTPQTSTPPPTQATDTQATVHAPSNVESQATAAVHTQPTSELSTESALATVGEAGASEPQLRRRRSTRVLDRQLTTHQLPSPADQQQDNTLPSSSSHAIVPPAPQPPTQMSSGASAQETVMKPQLGRRKSMRLIARQQEASTSGSADDEISVRKAPEKPVVPLKSILKKRETASAGALGSSIDTEVRNTAQSEGHLLRKLEAATDTEKDAITAQLSRSKSMHVLTRKLEVPMAGRVDEGTVPGVLAKSLVGLKNLLKKFKVDSDDDKPTSSELTSGIAAGKASKTSDLAHNQEDHLANQLPSIENDTSEPIDTNHSRRVLPRRKSIAFAVDENGSPNSSNLIVSSDLETPVVVTTRKSFDAARVAAAEANKENASTTFIYTRTTGRKNRKSILYDKPPIRRSASATQLRVV